MNFESTLPLGQPDLMKVSAYRRYLSELARSSGGDSLTTMSALSPSLLMDLVRFEEGGRQTEVLEVLAAGIRHGRALVVHLQYDDRVLPLTVFPAERLCHCPLSADDLLAVRFVELQVLHVEPAVMRTPGDRERALVGEGHHYHPLSQLAWELAMRGGREDLLPEIAGPAAYRVAPGLNLRDLTIGGTLQAAVRRLQKETANLRAISEWPGFDRSRAMRLLNALYLQAGLIVSRSHPAATNDTWFGSAG